MDQQQIDQMLQNGIRAARRNHAEPARKLLIQVVQANPQNEEAWLWLSRVVDNPQQRNECLQRVLQINPDNRWATDQLAALQGVAASVEESAPAAPPDSSAPPPLPAEEEGGKYKRLQPKKSELKLEVLACPHCGANVDLQTGIQAKTLVCNHCGSILDLTSEQAAIIGQIKRRVRPAMPIKLGMEATFKDERHQVVGWIRYEGWDDEDRWRWDEWLLASASGKFRWLSYDDEAGFIINEKIKPLAPFDPKTASAIRVPEGVAYVTERSPAKVVAFDGELTWQCKIGEQFVYFDAKCGSTPYSVEYNKGEVELFQGEPLTDTQIWTAFGREDLAKTTAENADWNRAYRIIAAFCVLLAVISCIGASVAGFTGRQLLSEQVQMSKGTQVKTIGPITLTEAQKVHRINLNAGSIATGNWAVVDVSARDTEGNQAYLFSGEFWDEEGYDSDGHWHESDLNDSYLFKLETPGDYYLDLSMEEATIESLPVTVTLDQGVWLGRYFIAFLVLAAILTFVFFSLSNRRLSSKDLTSKK